MLGCGGVLLLFLLMATIIGSLVSRHPDRFRTLLASAFDAIEDELGRGFGPDVTAADRAEFAAARHRFRKAWVAGELPPSAADRLRRRLIADSRKSPLGRSDVRALSDFLNRMAAESRRPPATGRAA
jgi:hypothetical protein